MEVDVNKVLVVEDEFLVALDIEDALVGAGFEVCGPASTLEEALASVSCGDFDVALLDANLNGKPVLEVASRLSEAGIPFAFVSGYGRETLPAQFGHIAHVPKPFDPPVLLAEVRRLIASLKLSEDGLIRK
jgi:DNA-binding response OmpR family regulator